MALFVLDVFIAMETAQIYERVKERVRERLRKTERHRWLWKEEVGGWAHYMQCVSCLHIYFSSCFLSSLNPSFYIGAFWNEQKYAINYLHQKFNICGSVWLASPLTLEQFALTNRYVIIHLRLGHYCQLVMFCCIVHTCGISDPHLNLSDCKMAKCVFEMRGDN